MGVRDAAPAASPPTECPKCGLTPLAGDACARCGLLVARMAAWSEDAAVAPSLAAAWEACLAAWDDPAAHDRAASVALTVGEQPWLARRYRAYLRDHPDDAVAAARLARVARIAQAAVLATASTPHVSRFRRGSAYVVLAALAFAVIGGLLITLYLVRRNAPADDTVVPGTRTPARRAGTPGEPWQRSELRASPPPRTAPPRPPTPRVESGAPAR